MSRLANNTSRPDFRTRLVAFVLVLAVGFVMGWVNGRGGQDSRSVPAGIVAAQRQESVTQGDDDATSGQEATSAQDTQADSSSQDDATATTTAPTRGPTVEEDGRYTSRDEVALYLHTYGHLPDNFISKTKARERGWVASKGNLDEVCPGMSIGGSQYYNDDGQLPEKIGRRWTECDINYDGGFRGAERIVFSNDGLVYYTADHYQTFEQLY